MDPSTDNVDTSAACHSNQHHETPRLCCSGCGTTENKDLCSPCCKRLPNINTAQEKEIDEIGGARISESASSSAPTPPRPRSRCSVCRRRLGLLGFACRCGAGFCGAHRHPEAHGCTFDFKEAGKIVIVKQNPIIKADKMPHRI